MANTLKIADLHRYQFEHQFSLPANDPFFSEVDKKFFITYLKAAGAWTLNYKTVRQETPFTRTGAYEIELHHPVCALPGFTTVGVTEVSGYWIPA